MPRFFAVAFLLVSAAYLSQACAPHVEAEPQQDPTAASLCDPPPVSGCDGYELHTIAILRPVCPAHDGAVCYFDEHATPTTSLAAAAFKGECFAGLWLARVL